MTNNYFKRLAQALRLSPFPQAPPMPDRTAMKAELDAVKKRIFKEQAEGSVLLSAGKINKTGFVLIDEDDEAQAAR